MSLCGATDRSAQPVAQVMQVRGSRELVAAAKLSFNPRIATARRPNPLSTMANACPPCTELAHQRIGGIFAKLKPTVRRSKSVRNHPIVAPG